MRVGLDQQEGLNAGHRSASDPNKGLVNVVDGRVHRFANGKDSTFEEQKKKRVVLVVSTIIYGGTQTIIEQSGAYEGYLGHEELRL